MANVHVGCKLPNGLIMELIPLPPTDIKEQRLYPAPAGKRVVLKGSNSLRRNVRASQPAHLFAVTAVDETFAREWFKRNADMEFVKQGLVFIANTEGAATGMAKERAEQKTGLEPLAQKDDPRLPKGRNPQTTVEADEQQPLGRDAAAA